MKIYLFNGTHYKSLPDPFQNTSPMTDELFEQLGGIIYYDGTPTPQEEFNSACTQFRTICASIGQFIGDENFHGGFGEMAAFAQSEAYQTNPVMGNTLAIQWSAANEQCKYFGGKVGLAQPDWWYNCWEQVGLDLHTYLNAPSNSAEEAQADGQPEELLSENPESMETPQETEYEQEAPTPEESSQEETP